MIGAVNTPECDVGETDRMVALRLRQYRLMHVTDVERLVEVLFGTAALGKCIIFLLFLLLFRIGNRIWLAWHISWKDLRTCGITFFLHYRGTELILGSL